jgi:uncharacterized protein (TIGR00725 family)
VERVRTVIGVMGGAVADEAVLENARETGRLIAEEGWVLLTGGRDAGVMAAASQGASDAGGLVIGVLPGDSTEGTAPHVDVAIPTGMGDARNAINVLASQVVIALPGGAGTVSEIALALKSGRPVVLLGFPLGRPFERYYLSGRLIDADTPQDAVAIVTSFLAEDDLA